MPATARTSMTAAVTMHLQGGVLMSGPNVPTILNACREVIVGNAATARQTQQIGTGTGTGTENRPKPRMSAAARRKIAAVQRQRWANQRKIEQQATAATGAAGQPQTTGQTQTTQTAKRGRKAAGNGGETKVAAAGQQSS